MCQFCMQHGAGKKWYLSAQNYTEKLAASEGRESFIHNFFKNYERNYPRSIQLIDTAIKVPLIKDFAEMKVNNYFKQKHAGQVISLEDAISICNIPGRVSVIECPCQKYLSNKSERKCILFGTTADIVENIPQFSDIHDMDSEESAELLKSTEADGKIHTIWTFKTPYIGAICNCDQKGCLLFHLKEKYKFADIILKGHEIAQIDHDICIGCGKCQMICQFNAIEIIEKKAIINNKCYGCGVCRTNCPMEAIQLSPRTISNKFL